MQTNNLQTKRKTKTKTKTKITKEKTIVALVDPFSTEIIATKRHKIKLQMIIQIVVTIIHIKENHKKL